MVRDQHNGLTAYGVGANMTSKAHRAMTCACMTDGERYNGSQNVLPENYFKTLAVGDYLNSTSINPLIWQR